MLMSLRFTPLGAGRRPQRLNPRIRGSSGGGGGCGHSSRGGGYSWLLRGALGPNKSQSWALADLTPGSEQTSNPPCWSYPRGACLVSDRGEAVV